MAGQAAHDLFLDKAMPGHTRASAAADECAGTFSQEVASVQLKLNMCHLTNQSYDDEDEEPDKRPGMLIQQMTHGTNFCCKVLPGH